MIAVHSPHHILHDPPKEIISNQVTAYGESPERAELLLEALMDTPGVELVRAEVFDAAHFGKVHSPHYLEYLRTAYDEWVRHGLWDEGILPEFFAIGMNRDNPPAVGPLGKAGFYMTDSCTMIVTGTWEAVRYSAYTALTAAKRILEGERVVFALCRPPGHHAGYDFSGGYCFLNNAAIAARYLQDSGDPDGPGESKAAILDIDFHHGNGTQNAAGRLPNLLFVSIHGDPIESYPYLTGYESENGPENRNYPLPAGMTNDEYFNVFCNAVASIRTFGAKFLVLSLGVDTFEKDILGNFCLTSEFYAELSGYLLHELDIPILVVMEGGYNKEYLAANVLSFLGPFVNASEKPSQH